MRMKFKLLIMFFVSLMIGLIALWSTAQGKEQRPMISVGERAQAIWEVQNVMNKHAYYQQVKQHCEELTDIWVEENGPYATTATWTSQYGVEVGIAQIKLNYCSAYVEDMKKKLEEVSKINPAIKNSHENIGVGYNYFMHASLLPVIEIAGDGKTGKGVWYSIGLNVIPSIAADGKTSISTQWVCEKLAVDFIKEDGKWKIWHFVSLPEPTSLEMMQGFSQPDLLQMMQGPSQPNTSQMMQESSKQPEINMKPFGARGVLPGEEPTEEMGIIRYITRTADLYHWTPTTVTEIYPRLPEPYYTFGETFSY